VAPHLLLEGGRTSNSVFKISPIVDPDSMYNIKPNSPTVNLLMKIKSILWGEATMIIKDIFEALDRPFKDIAKFVDSRVENVPFGGRFLVFGGDFRQILLVVPKDSLSQLVN
jgi:ATP-dependent DNA helicase PIF1